MRNKITMKKLQIAIIGSAGWEEYPDEKPNKKAFAIAYEVGKLVGRRNAILVCGGKGGIMEAACRGAKEENSITVGIVSGNTRNQANKYVDVEIVSGMINCAEEAIIISMCDGLIIIGGGSGTLQEIAIAYRNKKPMVAITSISGWGEKLANSYLDQRQLIKIEEAVSPKEAMTLLLKRIKG